MRIKKTMTVFFLIIFFLSGSFQSCPQVMADVSGDNMPADGGDRFLDETWNVPMSLSEKNRMKEDEDEGVTEALEEDIVKVSPEKEALQQEADKAVEKYQKKKSLRQRWAQKKLNKNIELSRKYLAKKDLNRARKYVYRALEIFPDNSEAADLLTEINKAEMFGYRMREEKIIEFREKRTFEENHKKEDPMYKYNEPDGVWGTILNMFSQKEFKPFSVERKKRYSIEECVNIALTRSQKKVVAQKQIHLAEMKLWEARRELFPEVSAKYELSSGKIASGGYNRHYRGRKYGFEAKHTVFDGFQKWFNVQQSQLNYEIVNLETEKIENEIIQDTKEAYYNLDKTEKALEIQHLHKEKINTLFSITEKAYDGGVIPKVEYLKVKGQNMQANFQYSSAEENVNIAHLMLFQEMDMEPDPTIGIVPMEKIEAMVSIGLENCYKLAYANRPDFKIKEKMIEHYDLERKKMKAKGWPKIDFHGNFGASYENFEPLFLDADTESDEAGNPTREGREIQAEWFAGATASIPLWGNTLEYNYVREKWAPTVSSFRGSSSATSYFKLGFLDDLKYFTDIRDSRVGFESAKLEYLDLKKDIAVEVKEAYFKYRKALMQKNVSKAQIEHQSLYMDILEERRKYGEMEVSRVIEEYDKLAEYEYGDIQADTTYFIALSQINKAIGVSNYFVPVQERKVYEQWKEEFRQKDMEDPSIRKKLEKNGKKNIRISKKYLKKEDFEKARQYSDKAAEDLGNEDNRIVELNDEIEKQEILFLSEEKEKLDQKKLEEEADRIRKEREKEELEIVKQNKIAQKNIESAHKYYNKGKYALARKYVYKALSAQPDNAEADQLLIAIDAKTEE